MCYFNAHKRGIHLEEKIDWITAFLYSKLPLLYELKGFRDLEGFVQHSAVHPGHMPLLPVPCFPPGPELLWGCSRPPEETLSEKLRPHFNIFNIDLLLHIQVRTPHSSQEHKGLNFESVLCTLLSKFSWHCISISAPLFKFMDLSVALLKSRDNARRKQEWSEAKSDGRQERGPRVWWRLVALTSLILESSCA